MDRMDFTHAVARIRVIEKKLLSKNIVERLIGSETPEETIKVLQDSSYGSLVNELESVYDYEKILKAELVELYENLYKISPVKEVIDVMSLKYDYHNIKVLIKEKAINKDLSNMIIPIGTLSIDKLKTCIASGELKPLGKEISGVISKVESAFEETKDPQVIDTLLDQMMFEHMMNLATKMDIDFIKKYVEILIDVTNIKMMLRVKKQNKESRFLKSVLIPGGTIKNELLMDGVNEDLDTFINKISRTPYAKVLSSILEDYTATGNITSLDVLYDNYIMNHAKEAKRVNFGPEPIIAYIIAKETEIKIIRIIMVGKVNKVSEEVIRERLRELYV